ncbi:MAG: hypothetical protein IPQ04_05365 [Saprospiraceae bacterium]|nr:hypothetical protein [Saprospiraceae bacterium]
MRSKVYHCILVFISVIFFSQSALAVCPTGGGTTMVMGNDGVIRSYKIIYFGTSSLHAGSTQDGSMANPILSWSASSGGVIDAINDCGGNILVKFLDPCYTTDGAFGNINYTVKPLSTADHVLIDGNGATVRRGSGGGSAAFLEILNVDNWTVQNINFFNFSDGTGSYSVMGVYGSTNVLLNNLTFNNNTTVNPVEIINEIALGSYAATSVSITNSSFNNNHPAGALGAVPTSGAMTINAKQNVNMFVHFENTSFVCNNRNGDGGAIDINSVTSEPSPGNQTTVIFRSTSFEGNKAVGTAGNGGGAISVKGRTAKFDIYDSQFCGNMVTNDITGDGGGAAIYAYETPLVIDNTIFRRNSNGGSSTDGGAIAVVGQSNSKDVIITNSVFFYNNTPDDGGAIANFNNGANMTISGSLFVGNNGSGSGGAIYTERPTAITNTTVRNNTTAGTQGAGIWANQPLTITGSQIYNNTSSAGFNTNNITNSSTTTTTTSYIGPGGGSVGNCTVGVGSSLSLPADVACGCSMSVCKGSSITLTSPVSSANNSWPAGGSNTTGSTNVVTSLVAGTSSYNLTITDGCGIANIAPFSVTFFPCPASGINVTESSTTNINDGTICAGASVTVTAFGGGNYSWTSSGGVNCSVATNSSLVLSNVTSNTTLTASITSANGCESVVTRVITVLASTASDVTISALDNSGLAADDMTICAGGNATLSASGGTSYTWSSGVGTTVTSGSLIVAPTSTSVYTVSMTNDCGINATGTKTITVVPLPSINSTIVEFSGTADNDNTICAGSSATLSAGGD